MGCQSVPEVIGPPQEVKFFALVDRNQVSSPRLSNSAVRVLETCSNYKSKSLLSVIIKPIKRWHCCMLDYPLFENEFVSLHVTLESHPD
ncbi:hypothetical protein TNCT_687611 [Trichonephila clavata]|uniref:Uncharacterized protein n=1 Tax=Trichonephila clavata TaxID=2740835 RepID=A0A8X6K3T3_TRICU|nr:hypothetical protein TNCT_687611 [Trichonephila clavata]